MCVCVCVCVWCVASWLERVHTPGCWPPEHDLIALPCVPLFLLSRRTLPPCAACRYEAALKFVDSKVPINQRNESVLLMEARCYQQLGRANEALRASARLLQKAASHGTWARGSARMLAVTLGANAAMEFGSSKKALKFYQTVLKFDPDHKEVRKQYRGLKKVVKLLKEAEDKLTEGYNRKAMEIVDQCLSAIRGLDVDSPIFRSIIQLKLCRVQSGLGLHEVSRIASLRHHAVFCTPCGHAACCVLRAPIHVCVCMCVHACYSFLFFLGVEFGCLYWMLLKNILPRCSSPWCLAVVASRKRLITATKSWCSVRRKYLVCSLTPS